MNQISPLAFVHPEAKLGEGNIIGPFCYIDKNTVIGDNNVMQNSVTINYGARIGNNNEFMLDYLEIVPKSVYGVGGATDMEDDL